MATATLNVNGVNGSTGTWSGLTAGNVSASDNNRATTSVAGNTATFALDAPTDIGTATAIVLNIEWQGSGDRPKSILVELLDSTGALVNANTTYTTPTSTAGTDRTDNSASITVNANQSDVDGWQVRVTVEEGGGMPSTPNWGIDRVWVGLTYDLAATVHNCIGETSGAATTSGTLGIVKPLSGTVNAAATTSADLLVTRRLDGSASGAASSSSTLTTVGSAVLCVGSATGTASSSVSLAVLSSDFAHATALSPASALDGFMWLIDLSRMPAAWWSRAENVAANKGHVYLDDGTQLATAWLDYDHAGQAGWVLCADPGGSQRTGAEVVRVYPPISSRAQILPSDPYGIQEVFDADVAAFFYDMTQNLVDQNSTTINGTTTGSGKVGTSRVFNGTSDYIETGQNYQKANNWGYTVLFKATSGATGGRSMLAYFLDTSNNWFAIITNGEGFQVGTGSPYIEALATSTDLKDDAWHIGQVRDDGTNLETWVDGVAEGGPTDSTAGHHTFADNLEIGRRPDGTNYFDGELAYIMVHAAGRTDDWLDHEFAMLDDQATFWGTWAWNQQTQLVGSASGAASTSADLTTVSTPTFPPTSTPSIAAVKPPTSDLTDFTLAVDLSTLPQAWWDQVDTSDGTKGRASKADGTELACDWIAFDDVNQTGLLRVKWSGTLHSDRSNVLVIYPPEAANASYAAGDTYGQHNAYDANWKGYWPLQEDAGTGTGAVLDRTSNGNHGTQDAAATEVSGVLGGGLDFGNAYAADQGNRGEGVVVPYDASLFSSNAFTTIAWARYPTGRNQAVNFSRLIHQASGTTGDVWASIVGAGGEDQFQILRIDGANVGEDSSANLDAPRDQWRHIVWGWDSTQDSGAPYLWFDYDADGGLSVSGDTTAQTDDLGDIGIGRHAGGGLDRWFGGHLQDVSFHDVRRSDAWVEKEYRQFADNAAEFSAWESRSIRVLDLATDWYDLRNRTGQVLDGEFVASTLQLGSTTGSDTNDPAHSADGLDFAGDDDWCVLDSSLKVLGGADRTMYVAGSRDAQDVDNTLVSYGNSGTNDQYWGFAFHNFNRVEVAYWGGRVATATQTLLSGPFRVAARYDGTDIHVRDFVNAETATGTVAINTVDSQSLYLGRPYNTASLHDGPISIVAFFDIALTDQQLTNLDAEIDALLSGGTTTHQLVGSASGVASSSADLSVETTHNLVGTASGVASSAATLTPTRTLVGASSGVASSAATLTVTRRLSASASGAATTSATATTTRRLSASASGVASSTSTLTLARTLVGSSTGAATAAATATRVATLVGSSTGAATATGTIRDVVLLVGSATATASTSGAASVTRRLAASASAAATSSATLTVGAEINLVGSASGAATLSATASVVHNATGSASGLATSSATLTATKRLSASASGSASSSATATLGRRLSGAATGAATTTATLRLGSTLVGSASGSASASATLSRLTYLTASASGSSTSAVTVTRTLRLSGASSGTSTVSGSLRLALALSASADGLATASATGRLTRRLSASASGASTESATLSTVSGLVGSTSGAATTAATASIVRRASGSASGAATTAAVLSVGAEVNLVGTATGAATVSATASVLRNATGSAAGAASATGALTVSRRLSGATTASATTAATITRTLRLAGAASGTATATATATIFAEFGGATSGAATVSGSLHLVRNLSGSASGSATATASTATIQNLVATTAGAATTAATVTRVLRLSGSVSGAATASASAPRIIVTLAGAGAGTGTTAATVVIGRRLAAAASGSASAAAALRLTLYLDAATTGAATGTPTLTIVGLYQPVDPSREGTVADDLRILAVEDDRRIIEVVDDVRVCKVRRDFV